MRRPVGLALIGLTVLLAAAACGSGQPAAAPRSLIDCQNVAQVKPAQFLLACADGGEILAHLSWSSWGTTATGTGVDQINDCLPNCAKGKFQTFPVRVTLSGGSPVPPGLNVKSGEYYTAMTLHYTGRRPLVYSRDGTATPGAATRAIQLWAPSSR